MHFTPTSASWLNMVERFFRDITTERLRRAVFTSIPELIGAIDEYVAHHNTNPKPFIWTKSARDILQKVIRANSRLSSKQKATLEPNSLGDVARLSAYISRSTRPKSSTCRQSVNSTTVCGSVGPLVIHMIRRIIWRSTKRHCG